MTQMTEQETNEIRLIVHVRHVNLKTTGQT